MPDLDVSDILLDSDFCEMLTVNRNTQSVANDGMAINSSTVLNPYGVVTAGNPAQVIRTDSYEAAHNSITVHAYNFTFLNPSNGFSPDTVIWNGDSYLVKKVYNWSKFGTGFTSAECELNTSVM